MLETVNAPWDSLVPLNQFAVPEFDSSTFPSFFWDYIMAVSVATETPKELVAMAALGVLSTASLGKFEIEVKPGHREPINLYVLAAMESGNRKSAVLDLCKFPLEEWEKEKALELTDAIRRSGAKRRNQEALIKSLRNQLGKKNSNNEEIGERIIELESNLVEQIRAPRIYVDDITPERLGTLMAEQGGRLAILSDEGGIFDLIGGRYSQGVPNLDLVLKAYSGSSVRIDRNGDQVAVRLDKPLLTIVLCPQPAIISALSSKGQFRSLGLLARFLFSVPLSPLGFRTGETVPVPETIRETYRSKLRSILSIEVASPRVLPLSHGALRLWSDFWQETEKELRHDATLEALKDWGSKLPGTTARIAGLFELFQADDPAGVMEVSEQAMIHAVFLATRLKPHALAAFRLLTLDPNFENANAIVRWLKRKRHITFTQRECHKGLQSRFATTAPLRSALSLLEDQNYIRKIGDGTVHHRPSIHFQVHTDLLEVQDGLK